MREALCEIYEVLKRKGCHPRWTPSGGIRARCPVHDDREPSLAISIGKTGKVVLHDFGGCPTARVLERLGLKFSDLDPNSSSNGHSGRDDRNGHKKQVRAIDYPIRDARGRVVALHRRIEFSDGSKKFFWLRPDGGLSRGDIRPADLPLFGIHLLPPTGADFVIVCEGEKPAVSLQTLGFLGLGTVTGASAIPSDDVLAPLLAVRRVYLWPDNDAQGFEHMRCISERLWVLGHRAIYFVMLLGAPKGADAADVLTANPDPKVARELILNLLERAQPFVPLRDGA